MQEPLLEEWHGVPGSLFRQEITKREQLCVGCCTIYGGTPPNEVYDPVKALHGSDIEKPWKILCSWGERYVRAIFAESDYDASCFLLFTRPSVDIIACDIYVASKSDDLTAKLIEELATKLRLPDLRKKDEQGDMRVTFAMSGSNGVRLDTNSIPRLPWEDIRENYSRKVRDELDWLFSFKGKEPTSGRIIILTGPPGTGKTYLIHSLLARWSWGTGVYLVDQELLGSGGFAYALTGNSRGDDEDFIERNRTTTRFSVCNRAGSQDTFLAPGLIMGNTSDGSDDDEEEGRVERSRGSTVRPRVLVIEDAGALIEKTNVANAGWGTISRILNMSDGLMARARPVFMIFTTNEDIGKLNDAIRRPGRCLSHIKIGPLDQEEVTAWWEKNGKGFPLPKRLLHPEASFGVGAGSGGTILADLYRAVARAEEGREE